MSQPERIDTLSQTVVPLETVDRRILSVLSTDARLSARSIARQLGISVGQVIERIKKLEERGVIKGYRIEVNHAVAGFGVNAFIWLEIDMKQPVNQVLDFCMTLPEVEVANWTSDVYQLFLTVRVRDHGHLQEFLLTGVRQIPGVLKVSTSIGLEHRRRAGGLYAHTWKDDTTGGSDA